MQFNNTYGLIGLTLCALLISTPAQAETETAVLEVAAIVPAICKIGNPDLELDLGSVTVGEKERTGKAELDVTCPAGTLYTITLGDSEQMFLEAVDKTNPGTPITIKAAIMGADGAPAGSKSARVGTGGPDHPVVEVTAILDGDKIAGSYSKQMTLTIDW